MNVCVIRFSWRGRWYWGQMGKNPALDIQVCSLWPPTSPKHRGVAQRIIPNSIVRPGIYVLIYISSNLMGSSCGESASYAICGHSCSYLGTLRGVESKSAIAAALLGRMAGWFSRKASQIPASPAFRGVPGDLKQIEKAL